MCIRDRYIQNVKIYRGKPKIRDINEVYTSHHNESICFVKKAYVQHWALLGVSQKFLVPSKNAWDPHPVNVTQVGLVGPNYHTLADNEQTPSVIEHKNTIATLFHIDEKYAETITILNNFVRHKIDSIRVRLT
eukprot:TRINITY_DN8226_c0_g1_i4.p2 TRINITY_DN8226_c0_g1~~TRINITY_DN8226_c0_g1_i4.p2  ORF type:complete len:133 (+),score=23.28 TRINITY_DN8226_c0_g1_i4:73-471(+)